MGLLDTWPKRAGEELRQKIISSPYTYRLGKLLLLRRKNYSLEAVRKLTALGLELAARAYSKKNPVVWTTAFFPGELLYALGFVPFAPEVAAAAASSMKVAPLLLNFSQQQGFASDTCSFHRCAAGGALLEYFPAPDFLVASSHLCEGAPQLFQFLGEYFLRPFYLLDVPARQDGAAERYVAGQLKEIAAELEKKSGLSLSAEKLRKSFYYSNLAREAQLAVNQLRRRLPSPMRGEEALAFVYLHFQGQGHPGAHRIYATLLKELQGRILRHEAGSNELGGEGFRLIWLHLKPYFQNDLLSFLERDLNARVVMEEMNYVYWPPLDPDRPFLSLARKAISHQGTGPVERRLRLILRLVEEYRAHGVIQFSQWGCRQSTGAVPYLKEELRKRGIPFLSLDGDCVDSGSFPAGQLRTRVEGFLEMLKAAKG